MIRKPFYLLIVLMAIALPVSADYTLQVQALTNSPADGATVYLGVAPSAPVGTVNLSTQIVPKAGWLNVTEIYDYSGTAGTNQAYSYYVRINNTQDYLVDTLSVSTSERVFSNTSMGIQVFAGDYFEVKRVQPAWTTNPLTNIVGGYVLIDTPDETDRGYPIYGMALTNSPADGATNYMGTKPSAPSTTEGIDKIFIPTEGVLTEGHINDYSGTAGTAEAYSYSMDVNSTDYLIETESVSANNRYFDNTSMWIPVQIGNYLEFKRLHPTWATNPLTNVVGGTAWINITDVHNINDGYPIHTFALTHTPGDAQTSYFGDRPIAPSTAAGTNKIYIRQDGRITKAGIHSYSGTAGSAVPWTMYIRKNNAEDYLIESVSLGTNERMWINVSMDVPVVAGDYVEIKSVTSTFATNPATTIYGGGFYVEYENELPLSIFTATPTTGTSPLTVQFAESTTLDSTAWEWYWTCAENSTTFLFNTTQNPENVFDNGHFQISLNVTNASGYRYNTSSVIISSSPSMGYNGFTQQDIYLTGQYTITFNVKSSTTNLPIANVTVVDAVSGQSYPSTNGTAFLTLPAGLYYVNFIADGYQSKQVTYVVDQDETHEVKLTPSAPGSEPVYNVYPPKDVKFHITSFFGAPIANASVTIQGITTSTGNWDWVITLLGISLNEVAINGTAMTETTDSNGDAVFLMLPSVKYNITTVADGYTFPTTILAPQATEYTITANWNESWFSSGNDTLKDVNVSVSWVTINSTHSFVNITYDDQTATTTGGDILVYREAPNRIANATPVKIMNITSSSCSNSTIVDTPTGGASYRVLVNATTTDQNIMRTFTHYFKGAPVALPGWTSETLLWLALFCVIFTAAFAGAIHSPQMAIVLCVESWVFWAIGWLDALITQFWYGEAAILGILTLASFLAVMWNITEGKSKVKRSS
jgi:hypothetical protein